MQSSFPRIPHNMPLICRRCPVDARWLANDLRASGFGAVGLQSRAAIWDSGEMSSD